MKPNRQAVPRVSDAMALVFVALVGGCWTETSVPTTITISPSSVTMDLVEELQLTTVVADQNGQVMTGITVTWSSDVDSIVSVTDGKLVTSVVAGQTRVHATVGAATGSVIVTVTPGPRGWLLKAYGALDGLGWTSICQRARICFDPLNLRDSGVDFPPFGSRRPDFSPAACGGSGLPA
ncbi:MAG: hypothetical protein OXQ94_14220 [Gemmatimonadota bacterium]|nr:hypothetical protein [Gemmatimonadota bacterium]